MSPVAGMLRHRAVSRAAQLIVGATLAWAALAKLGDIPALARDIHHFRLAPAAIENLMAMTLPWIELAVAASLVLDVRARAGSAAAAVLLGVFTLAVTLAWARGLEIECGCFGAASASRVGAAKLLQNTLWLGLSVVGVFDPRPGPSASHREADSRARM